MNRKYGAHASCMMVPRYRGEDRWPSSLPAPVWDGKTATWLPMCRPHGANAVFLGRRGSFHRRANRGSQQLLLNGFPQLLEPGGRFLNDIVDASLTDGSVQPFLEQLNKPGRKKALHRMEVGDQRTDAPAVLDMVRDVRWKFRLFEPSAAGA